MADLTPVYQALRDIMRRHATGLVVKRDTDGDFYVETSFIQKNKKPTYFGAVQIKKRYVSYHLMPVYVDPTLLDGLSTALRARMQGKSCFNFTAVDHTLFKELDALTKVGLVSYRKQGLAP